MSHPPFAAAGVAPELPPPAWTVVIADPPPPPAAAVVPCCVTVVSPCTDVAAASEAIKVIVVAYGTADTMVVPPEMIVLSTVCVSVTPFACVKVLTSVSVDGTSMVVVTASGQHVFWE